MTSSRWDKEGGGGAGGGGTGKKWSKFRRKWMSTVGERGRGSAEVRCPEL